MRVHRLPRPPGQGSKLVARISVARVRVFMDFEVSTDGVPVCECAGTLRPSTGRRLPSPQRVAALRVGGTSRPNTGRRAPSPPLPRLVGRALRTGFRSLNF